MFLTNHWIDNKKGADKPGEITGYIEIGFRMNEQMDDR